MDALQLLKKDRDKVKVMLTDLEATTERAVKTRAGGLATLKQRVNAARCGKATC